jgi:NADH-quinone oxidoreductase subunit M
MDNLLLWLIAIPVVGGCLAILFGRLKGMAGLSSNVALVAGLLTLLVAILVAIQAWKTPEGTDPTQPIVPRMTYQPQWMSMKFALAGERVLDWRPELGVDGPGVLMVLLASIMGVGVLVATMGGLKDRRGEFMGLVLLSMSGLLGVFASMDLLLFYICFEAALIPLVLLIARWGERHEGWGAAKVFLLYTLAGSIPMVVGIAGLLWSAAPDRDATASIPAMASWTMERSVSLSNPSATALASQRDGWIFALLMLGFGIKMAILPLHTWLPRTYRATHPLAAALLAAVVLKLGLFGFLRVCLPLTPLACMQYGPLVIGSLASIAIVYGALCALAQRDLRLVLAYSSLSHVGFITLGMFALNAEGIGGATLQMVNHGLTTGAMFLLAAAIIRRRQSADLKQDFSGMATTYPRLGALMVFFTLAGVGLPGLNNFVGELMALVGMVQRSICLTVIASLGIVLGAWYALRLSQRVLFGPIESVSSPQRDVGGWELAAVLPIVVLCITIGVRPMWAYGAIERDVNAIANSYKQLAGKLTPAATTAAVAHRPIPVGGIARVRAVQPLGQGATP